MTDEEQAGAFDSEAATAPPAPQEADPEVIAVAAALEAAPRSVSSTISKLLLLGVSVILFAAWAGFVFQPIDLPLLIGVLVLHESGHYVGMRAFGYRDVQMFFIPLFGAAVKGEHAPVESWKRCVVSLLGPGPGIVLGVVLLLAYAVQPEHELILRAALMLLLINLFNLLPFYPLDGGHLMANLVFSWAPRARAVLQVISGAALALLGFTFSDWIIGGLGVFLLLSTRAAFKDAGLIRRLRQRHRSQVARCAANLPLEELQPVVEAVRSAYPLFTQPGQVARKIRQLWQELPLRPPGAGAIVALLLAYVFLLSAPIFGAIVSLVIAALRTPVPASGPAM